MTKIFLETATTMVLCASLGLGAPLDSGVRNEFRLPSGGMSRIVGGFEVPPSQDIGYFALLLDGWPNNYFWWGCGGTLISNCHVLTAAHCIDGNVPAVKIGAYKKEPNQNDGKPFLIQAVETSTTHENYEPWTLENDVGLLRLKECIPTSELKPARLSKADPTAGRELQTMGFGSTQVSGFPSTLRAVNVPVISRETCNSESYYNGDITDNMICAGFENGGKDSCQGDSGGPIVDLQNGTAKLEGIVSWGIGCALAQKPGVYTSVPAMYDWIQAKVCADDDTDKSIELCGGEDTTFEPQNRRQIRTAIKAYCDGGSPDVYNGVPIGKWNLTALTNINGLFKRRESCDQELSGIEDWDVSNVVTARGTFRQTTLLEGINLGDWNVGKVVNMKKMFFGAKKWVGSGLRNWKTENCTNFQGMFNKAKSFQELLVNSSWIIQEGANTKNMFDKNYTLPKPDGVE